MLALVASSTRDLHLAEDALAHALERALRSWPESGVVDVEALDRLCRGLSAIAPTRGALEAHAALEERLMN
ncbi:hypothetical protein [Microcella sp.]|uniref:hypothetical protein n=1 Tax=Microcella sp. TaxID=1913979 RepID=UPI0025DCADD3|nr:hypothetical protein [Microcella sp.]